MPIIEHRCFFNYATSASWGAGTGTDTPTERMLNGLVLDNPGGEPATLTISGVPDGSHSVYVYVVSPPLQFQDVNYTVTGEATQTYYIRAMNSDEYNAAPGWYRGFSTDPNVRSIANYVLFENVEPSFGTITVTVNTITTGYDRGTGVNALQLVLDAPPVGQPPSITAGPQPTVVQEGGTARLSVTATGENLTYQWRKNGQNLPNGGNISGADTATLAISGFAEEDEGVYSVGVFNPGGSALSKNAAVRISEFDINADLAAYFKFDSSSGTTAINSAPDGVNALLAGTPNWAAGRIDNSLGFDGFSVYGVASDYPKAQREIAVSGWANVDLSTAQAAAIFRNAEGALAPGGSGAGQFELGIVMGADDFQPYFSAAIAAGPNIVRATSPEPITVSTWQHVAFSADGAQLRLYVDGEQVASTDYQANINTPNVPHLSIGARLSADEFTGELLPDASTPSIYTGLLDDLALWTRALTADEVAAIHAAGVAGAPLTTVVVTPPVSDDAEMEISRSGNDITLSWTGTGFRLQSADSVAGTWSDVEGVSGNTHTVQISGSAAFYRLIK